MVHSYINSASNFVWQSCGLNRVAGFFYGGQPKVDTISRGVGNDRMAFKKSFTGFTMQGCGRGFVRLAGLSGAIAVGMGAYGAHVFSKKEVPEELKRVYETASHYHLIHSLALMAIPLTRRPNLTGVLISLGMLLFCGSCYTYALTGYKPIREVTPYGGMLLIFGWISMAV